MSHNTEDTSQSPCTICDQADLRTHKELDSIKKNAPAKYDRLDYLPSELKALKASHSWEIFATHSATVRPTTDYEFLPGHGCATLKKSSFELPPGSAPFMSTGYSIQCYDPFVFANPPRHKMGIDGKCKDITPPDLYVQDLDDLNNQIWHRDEPRRELPYRIYADSKMCLKGRNNSGCIKRLMRPGW